MQFVFGVCGFTAAGERGEDTVNYTQKNEEEQEDQKRQPLEREEMILWELHKKNEEKEDQKKSRWLGGGVGREKRRKQKKLKEKW